MIAYEAARFTGRVVSLGTLHRPLLTTGNRKQDSHTYVHHHDWRIAFAVVRSTMTHGGSSDAQLLPSGHNEI